MCGFVGNYLFLQGFVGEVELEYYFVSFIRGRWFWIEFDGYCKFHLDVLGVLGLMNKIYGNIIFD